METVKGYSRKRKGTKHRVHKNNNSFPIQGQIPYSIILVFDFHNSFKQPAPNTTFPFIFVGERNKYLPSKLSWSLQSPNWQVTLPYLEENLCLCCTPSHTLYSTY